MFGLFRRKAKPAPARRRRPLQSEPRSKAGEFAPPSQEGHTTQGLGTQEVAHVTRLARLTPEQLTRVSNANNRPVPAQSAETRDLPM